MKGLLFHFEDANKNVYSGADWCFDLWRITAKAFGLDFFGIIDKTVNKDGVKYCHNDADIVYKYYADLAEAEADLSNLKFIYCESLDILNDKAVLSKTDVEAFDHPSNCVYAFGPDSSGFNIENNDPREFVYIKSVVGLWAINAASIVLSDRYNKQTVYANQG